METRGSETIEMLTRRILYIDGEDLASLLRRIGRLPVAVTIEGDYSDEERLVLERAANTCPVHKSLHPDIDAPITFDWRA